MGKKKMESIVDAVTEEIDLENDFEEVSENTQEEINEDDLQTPSINSPEWNDYVLSLFNSDELIDGKPLCAGLRRVSELLLGEVVESGPEQVFPATDSNGPGRATVVYKVVFNWMNSGNFKVFKEVADVWHGNTDDLFCAHPVATASTRAEGRALRKALKIKTLAAEELARKDIVDIVQRTVNKTTDGDWEPSEVISAQQVSFIDNKCKQLDIDVMEFVNSGNKTYSEISTVTKDVAAKMLSTLNKYQTKTLEVPEALQGYIQDWRK